MVWDACDMQCCEMVTYRNYQGWGVGVLESADREIALRIAEGWSVLCTALPRQDVVVVTYYR